MRLHHQRRLVLYRFDGRACCEICQKTFSLAGYQDVAALHVIVGKASRVQVVQGCLDFFPSLKKLSLRCDLPGQLQVQLLSITQSADCNHFKMRAAFVARVDVGLH